MDFDNKRPIYSQIEEALKGQIARGSLPPGSKMPSIRDLAMQYKVNPNTVQRAYSNLETMGILFTRRGQGTFVADNIQKIQQLKEQLAVEVARSYLKGARSLGLSENYIVDLIQRLLEEEDL